MFEGKRIGVLPYPHALIVEVFRVIIVHFYIIFLFTGAKVIKKYELGIRN